MTPWAHKRLSDVITGCENVIQPLERERMAEIKDLLPMIMIIAAAVICHRIEQSSGQFSGTVPIS